MKKAQFDRLVANIKRDGVLTSLPLVALQDGVMACASGNHRVEAGIAAGIEESDCLQITSPLTREQFVALQLSHNAIVGQDDPNVLRELYDELAFQWKEYSGLSDDAFDVKDLDTNVLRVEQPFYEELHISFLPGDKAVFEGWLAKVSKSKAIVPRHVGIYEDFRLFFETLVRVKEVKGVSNSAVALRFLAELAGQQLDAEEAELEKAAAAAPPPDPPKPRRKRSEPKPEAAHEGA